MAPHRQLAIIWTNVDPIHWRIYAALGEMNQWLYLWIKQIDDEQHIIHIMESIFSIIIRLWCYPFHEEMMVITSNNIIISVCARIRIKLVKLANIVSRSSNNAMFFCFFLYFYTYICGNKFHMTVFLQGYILHIFETSKSKYSVFVCFCCIPKLFPVPTIIHSANGNHYEGRWWAQSAYDISN